VVLPPPQLRQLREVRRHAVGSCGVKAFLNPPLHYGLMFRLEAINPSKKTEGEGKMSKDWVYGALTLLLAVGLVAALTFLQGAFSV
jgi:hypothetical protein